MADSTSTSTSPPTPDALSLLRQSIATSNPPIPSASADPTETADTNIPLSKAQYLIFNPTTPSEGSTHIALPLTQPTRFISQAQNSKALDLRSVYFCWQHRDTGVGEYIAAVSSINTEIAVTGSQDVVTNLVFTEKLDLVTWLAGDVGEEESEFIASLDDTGRARREAGDAAVTAAGGEDVEMRDAGLGEATKRKREEERLRVIYAGERKMGDRNSLLRGGKVQDFGGVRKISAAFLSKHRSAPPGQQQQQRGQQQATLTTNPALRPPLNKPSSAPGKARREEPIILLSPSASSLLTMNNIKSFLQEGIYQPPETSTSGTNILHISRLLPSINPTQPLRFILVDSPDAFRPDYWPRVVAVFTTGQTWQFKNYKWQQPAELFAHALGVYVGFRGEVVPETVRGWGRGVLCLGIEKGGQRWRDREVVEDFWGGVEQWMKGGGWGRSGR